MKTRWTAAVLAAGAMLAMGAVAGCSDDTTVGGTSPPTADSTVSPTVTQESQATTETKADTAPASGEKCPALPHGTSLCTSVGAQWYGDPPEGGTNSTYTNFDLTLFSNGTLTMVVTDRPGARSSYEGDWTRESDGSVAVHFNTAVPVNFRTGAQSSAGVQELRLRVGEYEQKCVANDASLESGGTVYSAVGMLDTLVSDGEGMVFTSGGTC
jgi:hypothetical protein